MKYFFLSVIFLSHVAFSKSIDYICFSGGMFDFLREPHRSFEYRIEYKPQFNLKKLRPVFGVLGTFNGSLYFYTGISLELYFNKHLFFAPMLAGGIYFKGGGKDLFFPLEFKSGIDFGYQFSNYHRISMQISHISNASLGSNNPGQESIVLTYSYPLKINKYK